MRKSQKISYFQFGNPCSLSLFWKDRGASGRAVGSTYGQRSCRKARNIKHVRTTRCKRNIKSKDNKFDQYSSELYDVSDSNVKLIKSKREETSETALIDELINESVSQELNGNQVHILSPKILRTVSSPSMVQPLRPLQNKSDRRNTNASCRTRCNTRTSSSDNLAGDNRPTDDLRILYTTPEKLTLLLEEIDQTRDILRPYVVNRARGMIDWALDELRRSINLSAVANQEFLKVGTKSDCSDSHTKGVWVTELFSKMSTGILTTSSSQIPVSDTLTPAVAAARESAFSRIAPSRNISVRLLSEEQAETDTIHPQSPASKTVNYCDNVINVTQSGKSPSDNIDKRVADEHKSEQNVCWNFRQNEKKIQKDARETQIKAAKFEESKTKGKQKDACGKSGKKMLKWKRFCEALGVTKSQSQSDQREELSSTETDKPTTSSKCRDNPRAETVKNIQTTERKLSQTLLKIRTGWKKFNDWLDE